MSKNYRNTFVIFLFLIGSYNFLFSQNTVAKQSPIVPNPDVYITTGEDFNLENELLINTTNLPLEIQNYLTIEFRKLYGISLRYTTSKGRLNFKTIRNVPKDSYTINVADEITITYSSEQSCFYAVNSFLQLVKQNQDSFVIPKCFVDDAPKFEWRGMHLDVSRHFFSVDEVKRYIDLMAFYKINKFLIKILP
jgi:hexosaminidase